MSIRRNHAESTTLQVPKVHDTTKQLRDRLKSSVSSVSVMEGGSQKKKILSKSEETNLITPNNSLRVRKRRSRGRMARSETKSVLSIDEEDYSTSDESFSMSSPRRDSMRSSKPNFTPANAMKVKGFKNQVDSVRSSFMTEEEFDSLYAHGTIEFENFKEQRNYIAYEILTTEDTYVKSLEVAIHILRNPIQTAWDNGQLNYVKLKRLINLFKFMSDILGVNQELLKELRKRFISWNNEQIIGDAILLLVPFLKMYRQYTEFFDKVTEVVRKAKDKDKYFAVLVEAARTHPLANCTKIESYLILPVQRIPRYVMLLSDLINHTPQSHPDYKNLSTCLDQMKGVAEYINDASKIHDNRQKCIEIERLFKDPINSIQLVEVHRVFVHQGILIKQCRKDKQPRGFFLFNDILIYGHPHQGKFIFPSQIELETVVIEDVSEDIYREDNSLKNSFIIKARGKSFQVYCESSGVKQEWINILRKTINENKERIRTVKMANLSQRAGKKRSKEEIVNEDEEDNAAPVWLPDGSVGYCPLCLSKFTLIFRRHHCRKCGQVVCGLCSAKKMRVPAVKEKRVRVCDTCYKPED